MDTNELRAEFRRARWGRKAWIPDIGHTRDHTGHAAATIDELEALEAVTVLREGVTAAPVIPDLDCALLQFDGEQFVAMSDGESTSFSVGPDEAAKWDAGVAAGCFVERAT